MAELVSSRLATSNRLSSPYLSSHSSMRSSSSCSMGKVVTSLRSVQISILFLVIFFFRLTQATWWLLGTDHNYQPMNDMAALPSDRIQHECQKFQFLTERQREMCKGDRMLTTLKTGAKLGIEECQYQLQSHRWNCSVILEADNVFGKVLTIRFDDDVGIIVRSVKPGQKSRENAYVHAISSASLAYQVTKACARGELHNCSCDAKVRARSTKGKWQWGGCSEDVKYGAEFSKEFVDSVESRMTAHGLMNLHNNEAGRRLLKNSMGLSCKCHGVSGSCTMKVCWRVLTPFREIGEKIREKFEGAYRVKPVGRSANKNGKPTKLRLKPMLKEMKKPTKKDLVFIEESPTYCERNETLHVLGTKGRICNKTSDGPDGCNVLCCGRGYQTLVKEGDEKCNCQFVWCCRVQCEKCPFKRDEHVCN